MARGRPRGGGALSEQPRTPEAAAALARERAAAGDYGDVASLEALGADDRPGLERLQEWAPIEVEPEVARSTRRAGAPITRFKRFLLRMLVQYHNEQHAQITRFNVHLLGYVTVLERRVVDLERRVAELERRG